jgi:aminoglycoside phosphotransferase family enzyme/predicted kinase
MLIPELIDDLSRRSAYPYEAATVEVCQTHISVVFLAGPFVYKLKKPVDLGFLDFTTLEKRRHFCHEEVRLNRRLAPDVYLGVVPVTRVQDRLVFEGAGEVVDFAVKMRRLPDDATLQARLGDGALAPETLAKLGRRIAGFHRRAASGPDIAQWGRWDVVARNARENLEQSLGHVGTCVSEAVYARLIRRLEQRLTEVHELVEDRAAREVPRDTHGDLHLDHVYLFPDRPPPRDLVVIDCIEFNERFRYADPVADMAFLAMDLVRHGRRDLADVYTEAYFGAAGDPDGEGLLSFYIGYRAAVRGKVRGMAAGEGEVPQAERAAAVAEARGHWLLCLSELEEPERRPCLVIVGGLPGTGKSTLASELARRAGLEVVSSDRVRKELAGKALDEDASADFGEGIYTAKWNDRTYTACLKRAREMVFEGKRVLVDASFREDERRRRFLEAADGLGVRSLFLECTAGPETARRRLAARDGHGSDADWSIYRRAAEAWEPVSELSGRAHRTVDTECPLDRSVASACSDLSTAGLL